MSEFTTIELLTFDEDNIQLLSGRLSHTSMMVCKEATTRQAKRQFRATTLLLEIACELSPTR